MNKLFSLIFVSLLLSSCSFSDVLDSDITSSSDEVSLISEEESIPVINESKLEKYYEDVDTSNLLTSLQTLMFNTHNYYPSYGQIRNQFIKSDTDPNNKNNIICFYSHNSISGRWDNGVTYNREHVWPKVLSDNLFSSDTMEREGGSQGYNGYRGAGSDLHHVRPVISELNEARGSYKFGIYEPNDNAKGDVARIIAYLYTHYSNEIKGSGMNREDFIGNLKIEKVFLSKSLLREWSKLDPVDELERNRNEYIYQYQGNRNPFIDHPEWVDYIV